MNENTNTPPVEAPKRKKASYARLCEYNIDAFKRLYQARVSPETMARELGLSLGNARVSIEAADNCPDEITLEYLNTYKKKRHTKRPIKVLLETPDDDQTDPLTDLQRTEQWQRVKAEGWNATFSKTISKTISLTL